MLTFLPGEHTDQGRRTGNEDRLAVLVDPEGPLLRALAVVADGMGGHNAGEVAASIVVQVAREAFQQINRRAAVDAEPPGSDDPDGADPADPERPEPDPEQTRLLLAELILRFNRQILERSRESIELSGMGTTVVLAAVQPDDRVVFAHVGDSRAYLLRGQRVTQMTCDHSALAERQRVLGEDGLEPADLVGSPYAHALTRSLGQEEHVEPEISEPLELEDGDTVLLVTDGITDVLESAQLLGAFDTAAGPQEYCRHLAELALERGTTDNVTAVALGLGATHPWVEGRARCRPPVRQSAGRRPVGARLLQALPPGVRRLVVAAVVLILVGLVSLGSWYASRLLGGSALEEPVAEAPEALSIETEAPETQATIEVMVVFFDRQGVVTGELLDEPVELPVDPERLDWDDLLARAGATPESAHTVTFVWGEGEQSSSRTIPLRFRRSGDPEPRQTNSAALGDRSPPGGPAGSAPVADSGGLTAQAGANNLRTPSGVGAAGEGSPREPPKRVEPRPEPAGSGPAAGDAADPAVFLGNRPPAGVEAGPAPLLSTGPAGAAGSARERAIPAQARPGTGADRSQPQAPGEPQANQAAPAAGGTSPEPGSPFDDDPRFATRRTGVSWPSEGGSPGRQGDPVPQAGPDPGPNARRDRGPGSARVPSSAAADNPLSIAGVTVQVVGGKVWLFVDLEGQLSGLDQQARVSAEVRFGGLQLIKVRNRSEPLAARLQLARPLDPRVRGASTLNPGFTTAECEVELTVGEVTVARAGSCSLEVRR